MKQNIEQQLTALKQYYLSKLPGKIEAIEQAWLEYLNHPDHDNLQILYRQTHNMSGSAGTYGYKELGDTAKKIGKLLREQQHLDEEHKEKINALITRLKDTCRKIRVSKNKT